MSAANRFEMHASAAESGNSQSTDFPIPTFSQMLVGIDITAVSGSFGAGEGLAAWLQGSDDGGTTWYDIPYDSRMTTSSGGADFAADTARRNITGTARVTAVATHVALYQFIPTDTIRLAWAIDGTTPSFTFSASAAGK